MMLKLMLKLCCGDDDARHDVYFYMNAQASIAFSEKQKKVLTRSLDDESQPFVYFVHYVNGVYFLFVCIML